MKAEAAKIASHATAEGQPYGLVGCETADGEAVVLVPYAPIFNQDVNRIQLGVRANYARMKAGGQRMMVMFGGSVHSPEIGPVGQRPMAVLVTVEPDQPTTIWYAEMGRQDDGEVWMDEWTEFDDPDLDFFNTPVSVLEHTAINFPVESNVADAAEIFELEALEVRYE